MAVTEAESEAVTEAESATVGARTGFCEAACPVKIKVCERALGSLRRSGEDGLRVGNKAGPDEHRQVRPSALAHVL